MIKKYKLILITLLSLIASVCLFTGCHLNENKTFDEFVTEHDLKANIVYILNDGSFKNKSKIFNMYYPAGAKPYEITLEVPADGSIGNAQIDKRNGYTFDGWYLAETSGGVPVYEDGTVYDREAGLDSSKSVKSTSEKFDFSAELSENDEIYLVARWTTDARLNVKLITEGYDVLKSGDDEYRTGDIINSYPIPDNGVGNVGDMVFEAEGYTFVSYYTDETGATRFNSWPVMTPENEEDVTIYAKFIEGTWTVVENTSGIAKLFGSGGTTRNYYFIEDVDCADLNAQRPLALFSGTIKGNGHVIKNLKLNVSSALSTGGNASMFGNIRESAVIEDITIENLTTTCSVRSNADVDVFFMCKSVADGATIKNVSFGGQLSITLNPNAMMANTTEQHWIFGGVASDGEMTGVTVLSGTVCTIADSEGNVTTYTAVVNQ